eukprot:Rhum_TRINITY_DN11874_c0_g2::Rhum_TRINITY_DN11874_c0_g2_i1::g.47573::m.47573
MFRLSRTCLGAETGKVTRWLPKSDYGFIQRLADLDALEGRALWVLPHSICTTGPRTLAEQQDVEFDVVTDHKGRERAVNVTAVGGGPPHPFDCGSYYND